MKILCTVYKRGMNILWKSLFQVEVLLILETVTAFIADTRCSLIMPDIYCTISIITRIKIHYEREPWWTVCYTCYTKKKKQKKNAAFIHLSYKVPLPVTEIRHIVQFYFKLSNYWINFDSMGIIYFINNMSTYMGLQGMFHFFFKRPVLNGILNVMCCCIFSE